MLTLRKILAPTDFSQASFKALETACQVAECFGAELTLLYVVPAIPVLPADMNYTFDVPDYSEALQEAADERLRDLLSQRIAPGISANACVSFGDPADEIVRVASQDGYDWIVIATHGLTGWRHLVFGSVAEKVVRLSEMPVLTVRVPRTEES